MIRVKLALLLCGLIFAGALGCDKLKTLAPKKNAPVAPAAAVTTPAVQVKGTVVAKVNNMPITLEDLNQEIESYNSVVPEGRQENKITTREQKISYLKTELVRRMLLYQEALDRGLEKKEDVIKALDKTKIELLVMALVQQEAEKVEVSAKEVEDYYNTYKDELKEPEERKIREIVVAGEQEAKDILIQLLQGQDFITIAREKSTSVSKNDGGDLGFIQKGKRFTQFDEIAFSEGLDVGSTSNIFKGPEGYYIVKVEAKRGGKEKPLSELREDIKRGLTFLKQQEKITELISKLSRQVKVEMYEGAVK